MSGERAEDDLSSDSAIVPGSSHARLIRFNNLTRSRFESTLGWLAAEVLPTLAALAGYQSIFLGTDPENERAIGLTFWDSLTTLKQGERVERPLREEAMRRSGGTQNESLLEIYQVQTAIGSTAKPTHARFFRWEGLSVERGRSGNELYRNEIVPSVATLPGFAGTISASDFLSGKMLGLYLWDGAETMLGSFDWERDAATRLGLLEGPHRPVLIDSYEVATAPELAIS